MRAVIERDAEGRATIRALSDQDSSMVTVLAKADALLRRPPHDLPLAAGDPVPVMILEA
jgi:molybdopterin molybdotransferase